MKASNAAVALITVIVVTTQVASDDRRWQRGTLTQVAVHRTAVVADVVHERMPPVFNEPEMTQVAAYVIETDDHRYHLQAMVALGSDRFALRVTVGDAVKFAVEKKTAYVKFDEGEYRLLVLKDEAKKLPKKPQ